MRYQLQPALIKKAVANKKQQATIEEVSVVRGHFFSAIFKGDILSNV